MTTRGPIPSNQGAILDVLAAAVGAGADATITVPDRARWRLVSAAVVITTNAVAANRYPIVYANLGSLYSGGLRTTALVASTIADYTIFTPGQAAAEFAAPPGIYSLMPPATLLPAGTVITATMTNFQAGDQINGFGVSVEEWIDP